MIPDTFGRAAPTHRAAAVGVPVAVAGSVALLLTATPVHAAEFHRPADRSGAVLPATLGGSVSLGVPAPSSVPASVTDAHTVQAGDTVSAIAARAGLRTADVLALNGLDWSSTIHPGQVLRLAAAAAPAPVAPPAPPDAPVGGTYAVTAGDTISAIAQRHGTTTQAVLDANGLSRSSIIYPGQTLAIPGAAPVPVADSAPAPAPPEAPPAPAVMTELDAEQIANAQLIISVGRELGVPDRGIAIALGTAMQESSLRNLDWGDRDSLGLFQQRPSTGWGTPEEVRDPVRATRTFYGGSGDPNGYLTRGLLDIGNWQDLSFADAAQAVQISAYPELYARWEQPASAWLAAHG